MTADLPGPDRATGTLSEAERTNHLRAPTVEERAPTEGVKLEPVDLAEKLARYMEPTCFENRRRSSRNQHAANKARSYYRKLAKRVLKFRDLPPSPQAAKRIEELEEQVARLTGRCVELGQQAFKAERQRDEAVESLEPFARHGSVWPGMHMSSDDDRIISCTLNSNSSYDAEVTVGDFRRARSVVTSIREG